MLVEGNAETLYYLQDDENAYIGANKTVCSKIRFYFAEDKLDQIKYYAKPSSVLSPMQQVRSRPILLNGFLWQPEKKPKNKEEIRWKSN